MGAPIQPPSGENTPPPSRQAGAPWPPTQVALTVKQVAEMFGTTTKAIYHRAERGQIPGQFRIGRTLMFRRADLLRFIAEGRGPSPRGSR